MSFFKFAVPSLCLLPIVIFAAGAQVVIKEVPAKDTSPVAGAQMFNEYCAACHGTDARGSGPAAAALKTPPTNLTMLARNHNGKYPELHVMATIRGDANLTAHGSKNMPVWGNIFREMAGSGIDAQVPEDIRIRNLTRYIETLQQR